MTSSTFTVTTSWAKIFDINVYGHFGLYFEEGDNKGSILFLENGNSVATDTTILNIRGVTIIPYFTNKLPLAFSFENDATRIYEIQKNNGFLEVKLTTGSDISVVFTLFSGFPDKNIVLTLRNNTSNKTSFNRMGSYEMTAMKTATVKSVSWMDSGVTSYDIEIFDKTNHEILLSTNLTNTTESIQNLGVLSNLPTSSSQIEISVKKNGGDKKDKIHIESVTICYN